jgi:hypothetical protein
MMVKAKAFLIATMIAVTRTATRAMVTTLIPATTVTVIVTAMAANRIGYLIVTAVTAPNSCSLFQLYGRISNALTVPDLGVADFDES